MKNVIIRNADHNQTAVYFDVDKLYRMDNGALYFEHNQSLSLVKAPCQTNHAVLGHSLGSGGTVSKKIWWTIWLIGLLPTFLMGTLVSWLLVGAVTAGLMLLWTELN